MQHIKQYILSFFLVLFLFPSAAWAEKLTLGMVEEIFPYIYKQGDQWTGIDVEIGRKIFERLGMELELKAYPWKRLTLNLKRGKVDGALGIFKFDYEATFPDSLDMASECMYLSKIGIFARKDQKLSISSLAELEGKSVGTMAGYQYGTDFDQIKGLKTVEALNNDKLIQRLERGDIDVVLTEDKPFWFYSRQYGFQDKFEEVYTIQESPLCMGFSKIALGSKSKILADRVSDIVKQLKTEESIQKILNKYR